MVYVPDLSYSCYVIRDKDTIRAYRQAPYNPDRYDGSISISYRDYYLNSNYLYTDGYQSFSYSTVLPVCLDTSNLTTDVYYRNDFDSILIIFAILAIVGLYLPLKIFFRFFKRGVL